MNAPETASISVSSDLPESPKGGPRFHFTSCNRCFSPPSVSNKGTGVKEEHEDAAALPVLPQGLADLQVIQLKKLGIRRRQHSALGERLMDWLGLSQAATPVAVDPVPRGACTPQIEYSSTMVKTKSDFPTGGCNVESLRVLAVFRFSRPVLH